jgi:DNA-binding NarL/FixJ family response regulator
MCQVRRALIADDHSLFRDGMSALLQLQFGFAEVLQASSLDEAMSMLSTNAHIDLALFDLAMPGVDTPAALQIARLTYPHLKIAIVTASEDRAAVLTAIGIGLNGFVMKSLPTDELVAALQSIMTGHIYVPRLMLQFTAPADFALALCSGLKPGRCDTDETETRQAPRLTPRQSDVLLCVKAGLSNRAISAKLGISVNTVKIHIGALLIEYGVTSRLQLLDTGRDYVD